MCQRFVFKTNVWQKKEETNVGRWGLQMQIVGMMGGGGGLEAKVMTWQHVGWSLGACEHWHKVCGCCVFPFYVLQLLLIRFTQQNLRCISKSTMKHLQNLDRKSNLP